MSERTDGPPFKITMVTPIVSKGVTEIETWGNTPDAEVVVHHYLTDGGCDDSKWTVSHRRTGKAIDQYAKLLNREDALMAAAELEKLTDWSRFYREGEETKGITKDELVALRRDVERVMQPFGWSIQQLNRMTRNRQRQLNEAESVMAYEKHYGLAERIAEIMRADLRLVSTGGEPCEQCGDTVDYTFRITDGCVESCSKAIAELVFGAIASGDIRATKSAPAEHRTT